MEAKKKLYPYQELGVQKFLRQTDKRLLFVYDMGLGKSGAAVMTAARLPAKRVLVVTLAVLRGQWVKEFADFWPEHPRLGVITAGRERKTQTKKQVAAYSADIQIVSYALLKHVEKSGWDLIIFDEPQRLAHSWSQQSQEARALMAANLRTPALGLTGTLIPNDVPDLWHPLHLFWSRLWPKMNANGRGSYLFNRRFANEVQGPYGSKWVGLNPEHADELRERLARHVHRVTRAEVPGLPPISFTVLPVPVSRAPRLNGEAAYRKLALQKLPHVRDWLELHADQTHKVLITWFRDTAAALAQELGAFVVTGADLPEARLKIRDEFAEKGGILVFNMAAFGVGVNMGFVTRALFVELYGKPESFIQAMFRFPRVDSIAPCFINALVAEGTRDEFIAEQLVTKASAANEVLRGGAGEDAVITGFGSDDMNDDDFMAAAMAMGVRDLEEDE